MNVTLELNPTYVKVAPQIKIADQYFDILHKQEISIDLEFKEIDQLIVEFCNKDDHDDNYIDITSVKIDYINMQHFIFYGKFYPYYNVDWYDKQIVKPPEYYCPGTTMRHNGVWKFDIQTPIFKMILNEWLKDER